MKILWKLYLALIIFKCFLTIIFKYSQMEVVEIILPIYYILVVFIYVNRKPVLRPIFWKIFSCIALLYHCYFMVNFYNLSLERAGSSLLFIMMSIPPWIPMLWAHVRYPFLKEIWSKEKVKSENKSEVEMNNNNKTSLYQRLKTFLSNHKKWVYLIIGFASNLFPHMVYTVACLNGSLDMNGFYTCRDHSAAGILFGYSIVLFLPNLFLGGICCLLNTDLLLKNYKKIKLKLGLVYLAYFISVPLAFASDPIVPFFLNLVNQYEWGW